MTSRDSFQSVASKATLQQERPTRQSIFTTPKPDGAFRDEIVVEIQMIDDEVFRGKITLKEARIKIFEEILGFKREDLNGMIIGYSGGPIVTYKLFSQFNIDTLKSIEYFELERTVRSRDIDRISKLKCRIRNIRTERRAGDDNYKDEGVRWVKVEGCEWRVDKEKIVEWLSYFGEIRSELTEDTLDESDDSADDLPPIGNGVYSVKMKLEKDLPQFMPLQSKRVRLYHRGIVKRCTNCFGPHQRRMCQNEKVSWFDYVQWFLKEYPEIPITLYGKWGNMTEGHVTKPKQRRQEATKNQEELEVRYQPEANSNEPGLTERRDKEVEETGKQSGGEIGEALDSQRGDSQERDAREENGENLTEEEELSRMVKNMLASGFTAESIKKKIAPKTKKEKDMLRSNSLGEGRGGGSGRGKPK